MKSQCWSSRFKTPATKFLIVPRRIDSFAKSIAILLLLALLAPGCGQRRPPVDPLKQQTADALDQLAAMKLTCIEIRSELDDAIVGFGRDPKQMERLTARKKVIDTILDQIERVKESIFSHSPRKEPSIDEIRHQEINHAELSNKIESIRESIDGFRLMRGT